MGLLKYIEKVFVCILVFGIMVWPAGLAYADAKLYISAVSTGGGTGHTTDDFVELFNPFPDSFNLKSYKLVKRTAYGTTDSILKSWTEDTVIPAYSFYLWANSNYDSTIAIKPDSVSSGSIADDNGVALRLGASDTGQIIDSLAWGQTDNSFTNVGSNIPVGQMLQRQELFAHESAYTALSTEPRSSVTPITPVSVPDPVIVPETNIEPEPTPPVAPDPVVPQADTPAPPVRAYPQLYLTELLPNPSGTDDGHEQIELFNPNAVSVELNNWIVDDSTNGQVSDKGLMLEGNIGAGEYKSITIPTGKFSLNNSGDTINLYYPDKTLANQVTYTNSEEGKSYQKLSSGWVWASPTFDQENVAPVAQVNLPINEIDNSQKYEGISINEFYSAINEPTNPWIEFINKTDQKIDLNGWKIDINDAKQKIPSDNAFVITNAEPLNPSSLAAISISSLKGTDFDEETDYRVQLFSPGDTLQDSLSVKELIPSLSYGTSGTRKQWQIPSLGSDNKTKVYADLKFTKILPAFIGQESQSFVEIQNVGEAEISLATIKVKIGTKVGWLPAYTLKPQETYAVYYEDLPNPLVPKGQKLLLLDANDRVLSSLLYPKIREGNILELNTQNKWELNAIDPDPNTLDNVSNAKASSTRSVSKTEQSLRAKIASLTKTITSLQKTKKPTSIIAPPKNITANTVKNTNVGDSPIAEARTENNNKSLAIAGAIAGLLTLIAFIVWYKVKDPELETDLS